MSETTQAAFAAGYALGRSQERLRLTGLILQALEDVSNAHHCAGTFARLVELGQQINGEERDAAGEIGLCERA